MAGITVINTADYVDENYTATYEYFQLFWSK